MAEPSTSNRYVVIIGWDTFSRNLTRELVNANRKVGVITESRDRAEAIEEEFSDDPVVVLRRQLTNFSAFSEISIEDSREVFVNLETDEKCLVAILNMKELYDDLEFVVVLENEELKKTFRSAGVSYVISRIAVSSRVVASYLYEEDVAKVERDLMSATTSSDDYDIQQYLVTDNSPYRNQNYGTVLEDIRNRFDALLIGLSAQGENGRTLHKLPDEDRMVKEGDYLIIMLRGKMEPKLREHLGIGQGKQDYNPGIES